MEVKIMVNQIGVQPQAVVQPKKPKNSTAGRQAGTALGLAVGAAGTAFELLGNTDSLTRLRFYKDLRGDDFIKLGQEGFDDCVKYMLKHKKVGLSLAIISAVAAGFGLGAIIDGGVNAHRNKKFQKQTLQIAQNQQNQPQVAQNLDKKV